MKVLGNGKNLTRERWSGLFYYLADRHGKIVGGSSLEPGHGKLVDLDSSEIRLMLPVGRWRLELHQYDENTDTILPKILASTPFFEVRESTAQLNLRLQLRS